MTFVLSSTAYFAEQLAGLSDAEKRLVLSKLDLIKLNPFRFKSLHSRRFTKVFRVAVRLRQGDSRLVYVVLSETVIVACILERKRGYRDLEKHLDSVVVP